jgi:hypothetical protein
MNGRRAPRSAGASEIVDGDDLRQLLSTYASGHEPDMARIWARLEQQQRSGWRRGGRLSLSRPSAIAGLTVAAASIAVAVVMSRPQGGDVSTIVPPSTEGAATPTSGGSLDQPDASTSSSTPSTAPATTAGSDTVEVVPAPTSETTVAPAATDTIPSTAVPAVDLSVAELPAELWLSADGYLDWIITGSRRDGKMIRLDDQDPIITVTEPAAVARSVPGPIDILWTDGQPEEDRDTNSSWWGSPVAANAFEIAVGGAEGSTEIVVYAGGSGQVTATVTVEGHGSQEARFPVSADGSSAAGALTIRLDGDARGRDVSIVLGGGGYPDSVALGAVTLR